MVILINISDFSNDPGLRHEKVSGRSGEKFYHDVLNSKFYEAYTQHKKIVVNLDGTEGYAPSFLDESFGNLVYDFTLDIVEKNIEIISEEEPHWIDMIKNKTFKEWEERRVSGDEPVKTIKHPAWYRFIDNKLELEIWNNVKQ